MNGMVAELQRVKTTTWGTEYAGTDGKSYLLKGVDREYPGNGKAPVYFLRVKYAGEWKYLSGLFRTNRPGVFSLDLKDGNGVRTLHTMTIADGGERAAIAPGKRLSVS